MGDLRRRRHCGRRSFRVEILVNHPYRIIVTHGGARSAVITLARVAAGSMPTRARSPLVEKIILQSKCQLPTGQRTGVCMPTRPSGEPLNKFSRELGRMYEVYDRLVAAPQEHISGERAFPVSA